MIAIQRGDVLTNNFSCSKPIAEPQGHCHIFITPYLCFMPIVEAAMPKPDLPSSVCGSKFDLPAFKISPAELGSSPNPGSFSHQICATYGQRESLPTILDSQRWPGQS
jgi:hypothetical protein